MILATCTWNCVELIESFLTHYRKLGIHHVLVMDFNSSDGTRELLTAREWAGFVHLIPFPGLDHLDVSNVTLTIAKKIYPPGTLCLFCDPDEFLVTPNMDIADADWPNATAGVGACIIPRFNMTAAREVAQARQDLMKPAAALRFRVVRTIERNGAEALHEQTLRPPWIFSAISGKVLVRLIDTRFIGDGDHTARCHQKAIGAAPAGIYLAHFPVRSQAEFERKVELAQMDLSLNAHLPETFGWEIRRWIRLAREHRLVEEYLAQFIPENEIAELLESRTLLVDEAVQWFSHGINRPGSTPLV